jgi:hypothetical protein
MVCFMILLGFLFATDAVLPRVGTARSFYDGREEKTAELHKHVQALQLKLGAYWKDVAKSGYMYKRIERIVRMKDWDKLSNTELVEYLIVEMKHERTDRNPDGNPDKWTLEEDKIIEDYEDFVKRWKQAEAQPAPVINEKIQPKSNCAIS